MSDLQQVMERLQEQQADKEKEIEKAETKLEKLRGQLDLIKSDIKTVWGQISAKSSSPPAS